MRVLLVHPFCPLEEMPSPPLGIAYLAAALERAHVEVKVLDLVVTPYSRQELEVLLKEFRPHMVGATAVAMTLHDAIKVLTDAKGISPEVVTVMGGPHISFCAREILELCPALDLAVIGEGDDTIVQLTRALETKGGLSRIRGIAYRDGSKICFTEPRPPGIDVDTLPLPARHLLPLSRYKALDAPVTMTTSRGCPFQCIFCVGRKMVGARVRYRNAQSVVDEFQYLSTLGFRQINIVDDLFTADKKHCLSICDEIMARGIRMKWTSFARVDTVSPDLLKKMRQAGCYAVSFGLESANPEILKTVRKGITVEQMVEAVRMCVQAGIIPHGSFILGLPGETPHTLKQTRDFGNELDRMGAMVGSHFLSPFPGTRIREHSEEYGIRIITNDWSRYTANRAVTETATVTAEMLDALAVQVEDRVFQRLVEIEEKMKKETATQEDRDYYLRLERMAFLYKLMMRQAIEKHGTWVNGSGKASADDILSILARKVADAVDSPPQKAFHFLKYAVELGSLACRQDGGNIRWEWKEGDQHSLFKELPH